MSMFPCSLYDTDHGYDNAGSSQNVSILAKGEPLTVLVTLHYHYKIQYRE